MKASEFKKILKPLVKQTIKEVLFEEWVLSGIVSEVARGLKGDLVDESTRVKQASSKKQDLKRKEETKQKGYV